VAASLRVPGFEDIGFGEAPTAGDDAALRGNALFRGVGAAALAPVLPAFRVATLPPDALLYVRGRLARRVFLILAGGIAVVQHTGALRTNVALLGGGEFTGGRSLLRPPRRHSFSAICREETRIGFADGATLLAALPALPWVGLNVASAFHRRVADAASAIEALIAGP
jgi:hypothetical protein